MVDIFFNKNIYLIITKHLFELIEAVSKIKLILSNTLFIYELIVSTKSLFACPRIITQKVSLPASNQDAIAEIYDARLA